MTEARTQDADIQGKPNAVPHAQVSMKACSNLALPGHATVMANCRVQQFTTLRGIRPCQTFEHNGTKLRS